jgi:hypothetical protein
MKNLIWYKQSKRILPQFFVTIFLLVSPANAKFWFGADVGLNSTVGLTSAITFFGETTYLVAHLDVMNQGAGYAGLAFRIPAYIGYVPVGFDFITGGKQNDYKAAFGFYTGFQRELTKNTMFYTDISVTPVEFKYRKVQHFNIDMGFSIALFSFLGDLSN